MIFENVKKALPVRFRKFLAHIRKFLAHIRSRLEVRWAIATNTTESLIRRRFNAWARRGRGVSMEHGHREIAQTIWEKMELRTEDRILDLGCGQGWACRLLAHRSPPGCSIVGVDISDEMIRGARKDSRMFPNVAFHCCRANEIPFPDGSFTKIFSIEAFFYFDRQTEVLRELARVTQPSGELYILICFFEEDPKPGAWFDDIGLPVHNRSIREYEEMLRSCGWTNVSSRVFDFRTDHSSERHAHDRPLLLVAKKKS